VRNNNIGGMVAGVLLAAGEAGDIARQAAAAPRAARSEAPKDKGNRFDALFTGMVFKPASATAKTYDEGGRKTKKIGNVLLELAGSATYIKGSVKAVQSTGETKPHAEFGFFGAVNQGTCLVTDDLAAQQDMDAFKARVVREFATWRKANGNTGVTASPSEVVTLDDMNL
jgi:hypothetical protein